MFSFFIDIDETITFDGAHRQIGKEHLLGNAMFEILRDHMVANGYTSDAAGALRAYTEKHIFWDYPDFIEEFKLPAQAVWHDIEEWHSRNLEVYDDAADTIRALHDKGHKLFIISNNPFSGCLLKLQRAGLGTRDAAPLFENIFCSNLLHGQKGQLEYWRQAIALSEQPTNNIAVIGDNAVEDCDIPSQAGLKHFFLLNRTQKETLQLGKNAVILNSMRSVLRFDFSLLETDNITANCK